MGRSQPGTSHPMYKHGLSDTALYQAWKGIKKRCLNKGCPEYPRYGGRGIRVHRDWINDAQSFCDYVNTNLGARPSPEHSIDRIDNDGDYCPGNIRWATKKVQAGNRSNTVAHSLDGKTLVAADWAKEIGVDRGTISRRRKAGLPTAEILSPKAPSLLVTYRGETHTRAEWSRITGISRNKINHRIGIGLPLELVFFNGNLKSGMGSPSRTCGAVARALEEAGR